MAKTQTREEIQKKTIKNMKALGTYKEQYNQIIDIYVDTVSYTHLDVYKRQRWGQGRKLESVP